jgi:predicted acyl esterase
MGDDDFHGGAFRLVGYDYYYSQDTVRGSGDDLWRRAYDDYDTFLRAGSASDFTAEYGVDPLGFPQKLAAHPAYDAYWQGQALDKILATRPHKVPAMFVQGQWDQEDIYGAAAVWEATRKVDAAGEDRLVIGPWFHGQADRDGSAIGPIRFDGDTAAYFRRYILQPFLDAHLKDDAPPANLAPVTAYETGTNVWRAYPSWPAPGVRPGAGPLRLAGHRLRLRSRQAGPLQAAPDPADLFRGFDLEPVAGGRPAHLLRPAGRAQLRDRGPGRAGPHRRLSPGRTVGRHHRLR